MSGICTCSTCGEVFNSVGAFDAHRVGKYDGKSPSQTRRCLTIAEMEQKMVRNARGRWVTGLMPADLVETRNDAAD